MHYFRFCQKRRGKQIIDDSKRATNKIKINMMKKGCNSANKNQLALLYTTWKRNPWKNQEKNHENTVKVMEDGIFSKENQKATQCIKLVQKRWEVKGSTKRHTFYSNSIETNVCGYHCIGFICIMQSNFHFVCRCAPYCVVDVYFSYVH